MPGTSSCCFSVPYTLFCKKIDFKEPNQFFEEDINIGHTSVSSAAVFFVTPQKLSAAECITDITPQD